MPPQRDVQQPQRLLVEHAHQPLELGCRACPGELEKYAKLAAGDPRPFVCQEARRLA
ncbi:hypothetical protein [Cellulosimicrobium sp. NPDC057862]|uniref:hypothetical protein n=1 Tax=Cellulosimicrobium sp. NPDC057862 TaxID=3346266 RepID=UPI00366C2656